MRSCRGASEDIDEDSTKRDSGKALDQELTSNIIKPTILEVGLIVMGVTKVHRPPTLFNYSSLPKSIEKQNMCMKIFMRGIKHTSKS